MHYSPYQIKWTVCAGSNGLNFQPIATKFGMLPGSNFSPQMLKNGEISTEGEFFTLFVNKLKTSKLARGLDAKPFYEVNIQMYI